MTAFGATLKRIRLAHGVSQTALARKAELERSFVGSLESGRRNPSRATAMVLAGALETTDDERRQLFCAAGWLTEQTAYLADPDCANLANLLATVDRERGEWIRATVRNLIAMNAGGMG